MNKKLNIVDRGFAHRIGLVSALFWLTCRTFQREEHLK